MKCLSCIHIKSWLVCLFIVNNSIHLSQFKIVYTGLLFLLSGESLFLSISEANQEIFSVIFFLWFSIIFSNYEKKEKALDLSGLS